LLIWDFTPLPGMSANLEREPRATREARIAACSPVQLW
jgi:hypothetical protein